MQKPVEPKKILCIHDLSGVGRCSLAVILPVLSVMGFQPVALPTVVLSTHTGGLGTPARMDGSAYGMAALEHYQTLGLQFDCIYTGYLGGEAQVALAEKAFALWPAAYKVVDPVMGDNGKAYSTVTPALVERIRSLCRAADLILPNYTEAQLLLQQQPVTDELDDTAAQALADALQPLASVARTCACTACRLHLVGPMGFAIDDKKLKHAGLDYWHYLDITYYDGLADFFARNNGPYYYFTTKAPQRYTDVQYPDGAYLVFGREDAGLPEALLVENQEHCIRMPMRDTCRSLNLSNSVAVGVYEVLRQWDFPELLDHGHLRDYEWK